jgi:hypothetical protein
MRSRARGSSSSQGGRARARRSERDMIWDGDTPKKAEHRGKGSGPDHGWSLDLQRPAGEAIA